METSVLGSRVIFCASANVLNIPDKKTVCGMTRTLGLQLLYDIWYKSHPQFW